MSILVQSQYNGVNKRDLLALYLSRTYCHMTGTRHLSCATPQQWTIYSLLLQYEILEKIKFKLLRFSILIF